MNYKKIKMLSAILLMVLFGGLYTQTGNFNSSDMMYRVSLVGAIKNPGIYHLPPTSRISEAILRANIPSQIPNTEDLTIKKNRLSG